jgi:hypothetical protein
VLKFLDFIDDAREIQGHRSGAGRVPAMVAWSRAHSGARDAAHVGLDRGARSRPDAVVLRAGCRGTRPCESPSRSERPDR